MADNSFTERSAAVWALISLTGIGAIYWAWVVNGELEAAEGGQSQVMRTVLMLIPIVHLYGNWVFAGSVEDNAGGSAMVHWITLTFLLPVGVFMVQSSLNSA